MRTVLGGPLSPIGWKVGFLRAPYDRVREATLAWCRDRQARSSYAIDVREADLPILDALRRLAPLQSPAGRELVLGTDAGWTAHLHNSHLGGDSESWTGHLSEVLGCEGVLAMHIPKGEYPYPATSFTLLSPLGPPPLRQLRTVAAGKYGGAWAFHLWGAQQPFEEPERYGRRLVRERFDRELLLKYLAALGIEPDRESFWRAGFLVETTGDWVPRESSLEEIRQEYGILHQN